MKPTHKVALVCGGYGVCLLVAAAAVALRIATTSETAQAAGGMYGFGDSVLFVAVFGATALVPTGAAFYYLRPSRAIWTVLSASCLAAAATGIAATILFAVGRGATASTLTLWAGYSVLRILISPLLALVFLLCAVLAPQRSHRLACLVAAVIEAAVSAYAAIVWFLPHLLERP